MRIKQFGQSTMNLVFERLRLKIDILLEFNREGMLATFYRRENYPETIGSDGIDDSPYFDNEDDLRALLIRISKIGKQSFEEQAEIGIDCAKALKRLTISLDEHLKTTTLPNFDDYTESLYKALFESHYGTESSYNPEQQFYTHLATVWEQYGHEVWLEDVFDGELNEYCDEDNRKEFYDYIDTEEDFGDDEDCDVFSELNSFSARIIKDQYKYDPKENFDDSINYGRLLDDDTYFDKMDWFVSFYFPDDVELLDEDFNSTLNQDYWYIRNEFHYYLDCFIDKKIPEKANDPVLERKYKMLVAGFLMAEYRLQVTRGPIDYDRLWLIYTEGRFFAGHEWGEYYQFYRDNIEPLVRQEIEAIIRVIIMLRDYRAAGHALALRRHAANIIHNPFDRGNRHLAYCGRAYRGNHLIHNNIYENKACSNLSRP